MSDIDFDELDQAVNALMKDKDEPVPTSPAEPSSSDPASQTPVAESQPTPTVVVDNEQSTPVAPAAAAPLSVKRRGRFMDVVHPKSDMTTQLPTKHQTTVIRPVAPSPSTPVDKPEAVETTQPDEELVETPSIDQPSNASLYPDPIDLHESFAKESTNTPSENDGASSVEPEASDVGQDAAPDDNGDELDFEAPQASPFLADAKVEKRPLGVPVSAEDEHVEVSEPSTESLTEEPEAQVAPVPVTSLPAELQPDVAKLDTEVVEPAAPATPLVEEPVAAKQETVVPAGGSIAQQYSEKPSSSDQANGAIYDTDNYHQPLQHPEKKKSSAIVIVWILVLALMGAIGAAGYFYMTMR